MCSSVINGALLSHSGGGERIGHWIIVPQPEKFSDSTSPSPADKTDSHMLYKSLGFSPNEYSHGNVLFLTRRVQEISVTPCR